MPIMPQSVGLLGGTFDPIHLGHLAMAEWVLETMGLQKVLFVPAGQPPHKAHRRVTAKHHRLEMVTLATAADPRFEVCRFEIDRDRPSLTIETLQALAPQFETPPVFIIGLDSLLTLHTWDSWASFGDYCHLAVLSRQHPTLRGAEAMEAYVYNHLPALAGKVHAIDMPLLDISSTLIRRRFQQGHACRYMLQPDVWAYIQEHQLYLPAAEPTI